MDMQAKAHVHAMLSNIFEFSSLVSAMPTRAVPSEEDLDKLVCLLLTVGCPKALLSFGD